jgi:uncharacterized protein YkwD
MSRSCGGITPGGSRQPDSMRMEDVGGIDGVEGTQGTADQQRFLELINEHREQNGLGPVELSDELSQAMTDHAQDMDQAGRMYHSDESGGKIAGGGTMENVAQGQQSVDEVFQAWMESPGHNKNMLDPNITEIGLGHVGDSWALNGG